MIRSVFVFLLSVFVFLLSLSAFAFSPLLFPAQASAEDGGMSTDHLSEMQKFVTMHGGTETPFDNEYWDHKEDGIYVDVISGAPLFSSTDKFDSGTGWPSFSQPIDANFIEEHEDLSHGMNRTEVKSNKSNAHLGHVFNDGPKDKGGLRYCINSAALDFIPKADLEKEGYGKYLVLFDDQADDDYVTEDAE